MNISLTPELEKFVHEKVDGRLYNSASEVIREALRLLQERDILQQHQLDELKREIGNHASFLFLIRRLTSMEIAPHISIDPNIHHGKVVITGTRLPVSIVVGSLAGGMSQEEVMLEYEITQEQIKAALAYAAELVANTEVIPLGA